MPEGVPWIQSRMWSQALLAAERALLMPRICAARGQGVTQEGACLCPTAVTARIRAYAIDKHVLGSGWQELLMPRISTANRQGVTQEAACQCLLPSEHAYRLNAYLRTMLCSDW